MCFWKLSLICLCLPIELYAEEKIVNFRSYSQQQGLSQVSVTAITQDHLGFIWAGTQDGLNRFDGTRFKVFRHDPQQPHSLSDNYVISLFTDRDGGLWIGTANGGLNRYNRTTGGFDHFRQDPKDPNNFPSSTIPIIYQGETGPVWVGSGAGLSRHEPETDRFTHFPHALREKANASSKLIGSLLETRDGRMWVGLNGLQLLDQATGIIRYPALIQRYPHLKSAFISSMEETARGRLWIGTRYGLYHLNLETEELRSYFQGGSHGLANDSITDLHYDRNGHLWVSTYGGGLYQYDPERDQFVSYRDTKGKSNARKNYCLFEDRVGHLWIGSEFYGIDVYNPSAATFKHLRQNPAGTQGLSADGVWSINENDQGQVLIGTDQGLDLYDQKKGVIEIKGVLSQEQFAKTVRVVFTDSRGYLWFGFARSEGLYRLNPRDGSVGKIALETVLSLAEDANGLIWTAGYGGLHCIDKDLSIRHHYTENDTPNRGLNDKALTIVLPDEHNDGVVWSGSWHEGLNRLNLSDGTFRYITFDPDNPHGLSHKLVTSLLQDQQDPDRLWVGTGSGLNYLAKDGGSNRIYRTEDGLSSNVINSVQEDSQHRIWAATNRGLSLFDPQTETFRTFDHSDGQPITEFTFNASYKDRVGRLYFGGVNGLVIVDPTQITLDSHPAPLVLSQFLVANRPMDPVSIDRDSPLEGTIDSISQITLGHDVSMISFEMASLDYMAPLRCRYAYLLEGYDSEWINTSAEHRRATYTQLPAGHYIFRARATNRDGVWSSESIGLKLVVLPPIWLSLWAIAAYTLALLGLVIWYLLMQKHKLEQSRKIAQQQRQLAEKDRATAMRLRELDKLKDTFLANTSHELRTPLHGIIGLAEGLIQGAAGPINHDVAENLSMVVSSGRRLSSLVNDILDFAKLEQGELVLEIKAVDLYGLTEVVLALTQPLARGKQLKLVNQVARDLPAASADEDRVLQILHNLIGNAVKFTHAGEVVVTACLQEDRLVVSVRDSGIGIPADSHEKIFRDFEQADGDVARVYSGTGLGLAISQQLVILQGGEIGVESEVGKGSVFWFTLPVSSERAAGPKPIGVSRLGDKDWLETEPRPPFPMSEAGFRILVVDDEPVNRRVLCNHLIPLGYQVFEASDGEAALHFLEQHRSIDLILLDVMMPGQSGYQVCSELRKTRALEELPVIFLTARNQVTDLVSAFEAGGNDFLTKPVAREELLPRVETHLKLLDIKRNLDQMVRERTDELEEKNKHILMNQDQLILQEKLASMGALTAGIAHELKNPLNFISNFALINHDLVAELRDDLMSEESIQHEQSRMQIEESLDCLTTNTGTIHEHSKRANRIIGNMMEVTGGKKGELQPTDLAELLDEVAQITYLGLISEEHQLPVKWERVYDKNLAPVEVVTRDMSRVFMNLIKNALEALQTQAISDPQHQPFIQLSTHQDKRGTTVTIRDNGTGIKAEDLPNIFTPFFTTRTNQGKNVGLGLAISWDIVAGHGGKLEVATEESAYTKMTIHLPLATQAGKAMAKEVTAG